MYEDLTGKVFGRLTVVSMCKHDRYIHWDCLCECGNHKIVTSGNLKNGSTRSCGCLRKETREANYFKPLHGDSETRLFRIWGGMRRRCYEEQNKDYKSYGARGITVCDEWMEYINFKEWAMNNGYAENLSIDRIDPDGNYCPDNCRWADDFQQANNRRSNRYITYNGVTKTAAQWSDEYGIPRKTFLYRINNGWGMEKALHVPVSYKNRLAKLT